MDISTSYLFEGNRVVTAATHGQATNRQISKEKLFCLHGIHLSNSCGACSAEIARGHVNDKAA